MTPDAFHDALLDLRAELAHRRMIYQETIDRVRIDVLEELIRRAGAADAFEFWLATRSIAPPMPSRSPTPCLMCLPHLRNPAERDWAAAWRTFDQRDRTRRTQAAP